MSSVSGARVVVLLALLGAVAAHPSYWTRTANSCTAHPTTAQEGHGAPTADATIKFALTGPNGAAVTSACPGVTHGLEVTFATARESLLTSSLGTLGGSDATCANRLVSAPAKLKVNTTLLVPCAIAGTATTVQLNVTSATGSTGGFLQSGQKVPISAITACSSPCKTDGTSVTGSGAPTTSGTPTAGGGTTNATKNSAERPLPGGSRLGALLVQVLPAAFLALATMG